VAGWWRVETSVVLSGSIRLVFGSGGEGRAARGREERGEGNGDAVG
jgi:hypothetical protein